LIRAALLSLVLFWCALAPEQSFAHASTSHNEVLVDLLAVVPSGRDDGNVWINVVVINDTGAAVTLRGFSASNKQPVKVLRRKILLGVGSWQPVKFIRIDASKELELGLPDYRIIVYSPPGDAEAVNLWANFGPLGNIPVLLAPTEEDEEPLDGEGEVKP
jgi:hypothetical protein